MKGVEEEGAEVGEESHSPSDPNLAPASSCEEGDASCVQISGLNRDERRSAFTPYRPTTVLTNLQRGNVQTKASTCFPERSVHQLAAQGELFAHHLDELSSLDPIDSSGFTPLLWAASYGQLSTVKLLLERGADPKHRTPSGESALLFAATNGHVHVVKELVAQEVDVNLTDEEGSTALMYAAYENHALCVHELLKGGADLTIQNSNLDTAYSISVARKSKQVQQILERHIVTQVFG